jgi:hypothetical protein
VWVFLYFQEVTILTVFLPQAWSNWSQLYMELLVKPEILTSYVYGLGHVARMGEEKGVHGVLVGKPEGKRPLGRPRRRWEDNIKMDVEEVGGGRGDWMELAQDRDRWRALVSTV